MASSLRMALTSILAMAVFLIRLFSGKPDYTYEIRLNSFDRRGMFYTKGQNIDINDLTLFTDGFAITKFKNVTSTGADYFGSLLYGYGFPYVQTGRCIADG